MSVPQSPNNQLGITASALAMPCLPARYARFGTFQIDSEREELFQNGERVKMQAKVYQTLVILVSQAGDIVTREEVGKRLWPERFPVTLDANVNTAMNKLRQALGDSPESPIYVETIPRRGYCFIAPLEFSEIAAPAGVKPGEAAVQTGTETTHAEASSQQLRYTLPMALRIATLLLAGMVVGALLVLAWYSFYARNHKDLNSTEDMTSRPAAELHLFRR
jgi:DNA-binding winged helix-turn-helix (wHTH) protein